MLPDWLIYVSSAAALLLFYWIFRISPLSKSPLFSLFIIFFCLIYSGGLIVYGYYFHKNSMFLLAAIIIFSASHKFYVEIYQPFAKQTQQKNS